MMVWQWTGYAAPLLAAAVICLLVAWRGWRSRERGRIAFAVLLAAVAVWTGGYALEICSAPLAQKALWAKIQYAGIVVVPVAWLIFSLQYADRIGRPGVGLLATLMAIPLATVGLLAHPDGTGLIWRSLELAEGPGFDVLRISYGPWFWVHTGYSYLLWAVAATIMLRALAKSPRLYRKQGALVVVAVFSPWILNVLYVSGRNPVPLDLTGFGFMLTGIAMLWALTRRQFLDLMPQARARVIESMRDGLAVLDAGGRIVDLNPAAEEIIGEAAAVAAIGRHFDAAFSGRIKLRELTGEDNQRQLETMLTAGSSPRHYELRSWPLDDAGGREQGRLVIFRDITSEKRAAAALEDSQKRLQMLIEQVPAVMWTTDAHLRFTQILGAGLQRLQVDPEATLGQDLFEFFGTIDDAHPAIAAHLKALEGTPSAYAIRYSERDFECHVEPLLDHSGRPCGIVGVALDVTATQDLQTQLRQSQKMEAIGRMAGGVAHDFNNLLTAVAGYAQLAREDLDSLDSSPTAFHNLKRDLDAIQHASERATAITAQLLAFSRRQVLHPRVLGLGEVLGDMEKLVRRLVGEHIELRWDVDPDTPPIKADPVQIEQVLINLVLNARDALPEGGNISIETTNVTLEAGRSTSYDNVAPGSYALLSVSDDGLGMDAATQSHIFEPFFTTKEEGKGTGLGLSTVYGIVKQTGGFIEVKSQVGEGSTLKIYFPAATEEPAATGEAKPATIAPQGRGFETILLVEDEEMVRVLATRVLSSHGYLVLEAENGEEALEVCRRHEGPIGLLITDVVMPGMNGRELADRLAAMNRDAAVLFVSGYTGGALVEHGALRDGTNFLQKPFSPQHLVERVREVLDGI